MHKSYEEKLGHCCDFRVKYKYYTEQQGGRRILPYQGIRSDFWYDNNDNSEHEVYMIWPEFEDQNGNLILNSDKSVSAEGTARMWIIYPERRPIHISGLKVGIKAYFIEGTRSAECEVIEIVGLKTNPQK